ncbi:hypothetical protein HIM_06895 [Hirsutella minnesotensis 3608]|uniref:NADPH-dependent 1-acyldihydroxyacetone phosphate reductase n=1 Tax=Hirsutella minnesotensis 3608 TaxID=1043627 RepID=A0A0F7ZZ84_9HYPO|nr:hypothetical protein HIM_06895 [Hirsutella minnesotensis 3608]
MAKSVLITGCSPGGIGHALAVEYHHRGCIVIATARRPEVLESLADAGIRTLQLDVTDQASVDACRAATAEMTGGKLDILVNNAGRSYTMPLLDSDMQAVKDLYEVNLFGTMRMCKSFSGLLMAARGLIVNMSSMGTEFDLLFGSNYTSSKSALNDYSRGLRWELKPLGVRVMVIMGGIVLSNIDRNNLHELQPGSLYAPARPVFVRQQTRTWAADLVSADVVARRIVAESIKGRGRFGGWLGGSPDVVWTGGWTLVTRLVRGLPWVHQRLTDYLFQRTRMIRLVREALSSAKQD